MPGDKNGAPATFCDVDSKTEWITAHIYLFMRVSVYGRCTIKQVSFLAIPKLYPPHIRTHSVYVKIHQLRVCWPQTLSSLRTRFGMGGTSNCVTCEQHSAQMMRGSQPNRTARQEKLCHTTVRVDESNVEYGNWCVCHAEKCILCGHGTVCSIDYGRNAWQIDKWIRVGWIMNCTYFVLAVSHVIGLLRTWLLIKLCMASSTLTWPTSCRAESVVESIALIKIAQALGLLRLVYPADR